MGNMEIEDALQELDKLTQEEARVASAELLRITHGVDGKVMGVDDRVKGVDERVQAVHGEVRDIDDKLELANRNHLRDDLLRWLSPADPSINHNIACKAHHNGTAEWFFQGSIFNHWKSTGPFLWVHGKPGSGKSILCSSIIQDIIVLRDAGEVTLAYFYFDFRDVDKQKLQNLLPSLLIQFFSRSDPYCDVLSRLYSAHDRGVHKPNDWAMVECLKEMLTLDGQPPTYIIMDAVDECPIISSVPSPREEVLELVDELVGLHLPNLRICVTSRPEVDIQAVLESLGSRPVSLHDESGQKQDIMDYVHTFVHTDRRMRRWRDEDKDLVIKTLSEKADGMFRWVYCQLEVLRHCFPSSVRAILAELPESLDDTYERILREIRKPNQGHTRRLLQCLVAAVRPLRVEELAEILAFDFSTEGIPNLNPSWRWEGQEEAVMSACSSLVIVVKDGDSRIVQFSHFSVKEYLISDRLATSTREEILRYHIPIEAAHLVLARACLGVLLKLDGSIDRDRIKSFPLARYAAEYWTTHAQFGSVSSRIKDGMECLFDADKPHFTVWLWIYDHDRPWLSMDSPSPLKPVAPPIYYASQFGFHSLVETLITRHPEDINVIAGSYRTSLHVATARGHVQVVLLLLKHLPVDIRGTRSLGWTPLFYAVINEQTEIGQHLINHGADVNAQKDDGDTPLHLAALFGRLKFMRLLLDHGADPHLRNNRDQMPSRVNPSSRKEILQLLSEYGFKSEEG